MSNKSYYEKYWNKNNPTLGKHVSHIPHWPQKELELFYNTINKFIGKSVLDIGAGEGIFLSFLNKKKKLQKTIGVEISDNAIKRGLKNDPSIKYIKASADTPMPIRANSFDTIFMTDVIEHLIDIDTLLNECSRILIENGKIIIITPDYNLLKKIIISLFFWEKIFYPTNPHIRFFTKKSLNEIMKKHGFNRKFYRWGLTWFNIMPQNMYAVYEKNNNRIKISMAISNPVSWRTPQLIGGGELLIKNIIEEIEDLDINVLQTSPIITNSKEKRRQVENRKPLFPKTKHPIFDVIQTFWWISISTIYLYKKRHITDIYYSPTTNINDFLPHLIVSKITRKKLLVKNQITIYDGVSKHSFINIYNNYKTEKNTTIDSIIRTISSTIVLKLLPLSDLIICITKEVEKSLFMANISKDKLITNQTGIEYEKLLKYNNKEKSFDLCYMSRIEKYKGIFDFLNICKELKNIKNNFKAIIIGDGSQLTEIKKYISKNQLKNNIVIKGFLKEERFKYLGESKLFILPSYAKEGFGLAIPEAITCGTEVLLYENKVFTSIFKNLKSVSFSKNYNELKTKVLTKIINDQITNHSEEGKKFDVKKSIKKELAIIENLTDTNTKRNS